VLKKRLAMNEPSVMCGGLSYEEGADLDPEEVADNAKLLTLPLDQLPGGGIRHGSIVSVSDQAQDFNCQLVISHKVTTPPFLHTVGVGVVAVVGFMLGLGRLKI
jgi:ubiquitin-like 1-activating enzyme E1 B